MTNTPNDYREPKITTAPAKKSAMGILPWLLLALGILVLLAWLFGAFDHRNTTATETTMPVTTTQPTTTTSPANGTTPAN